VILIKYFTCNEIIYLQKYYHYNIPVWKSINVIHSRLFTNQDTIVLAYTILNLF